MRTAAGRSSWSRTPVPVEGFGHADTQSIEPGFRARVEVAHSPHAHGGGRAHDENSSTTLCDEAPTDLGECGDGPGYVHRHHARRTLGVVLVVALVSDGADGDHDQVDRISDLVEGLAHGARSVRRVLGVKEHGVSLGGAVLVGLQRRGVRGAPDCARPGSPCGCEQGKAFSSGPARSRSCRPRRRRFGAGRGRFPRSFLLLPLRVDFAWASRGGVASRSSWPVESPSLRRDLGKALVRTRSMLND